MKKRITGIAVILVIIFGAFLLFNRFNSEKEEDMLVYGEEDKPEAVIDIAIQENDSALYIRKIKMMMEGPTLGDVIEAINLNNEGIKIAINNEGEIEEIGNCQSTPGTKWRILLDNEEINETNTWKIPVQNYLGITLLYLQ